MHLPFEKIKIGGQFWYENQLWKKFSKEESRGNGVLRLIAGTEVELYGPKNHSKKSSTIPRTSKASRSSLRKKKKDLNPFPVRSKRSGAS